MWRVIRHPVRRDDEGVRQVMIAVQVEIDVDPRPLHAAAHEEHFRAVLRVAVLPGPIEVHTGGIGADMAAGHAVRVHVGNDVDRDGFANRPADRVVIVQQAVKHAFHAP
jgi:hypothetical protein